jgi:hypothetical protein
MQHDFNIANQSFPATRTDLNNALQALASNSSGDAEPSTTFANQWWYETDTNTLKLRNEANNAWLSFATVDQSTAAWTLAHDVDITGTLTSDGLTVAGATSLTGNLTVDGGTIKLDGNYPVGTNNVALGDTALDSLTSGIRNTAIGSWALTANTTGNENTAVGELSLAANTTGASNTAFGRASLNANTTASYNTAYGTDTLQVNTTGASNTAIGQAALVSNTTASNNTAVGYKALYSNTTGEQNIAVGGDAGDAITTGSYNTLVGYNSGGAMSTGTYNAFYGRSSGSAMTTGGKNTILGSYNGNQGGLDIRTSSNNIVLSDGDGNPRLYIDSSGHFLYGKFSAASSVPGIRFAGDAPGYAEFTRDAGNPLVLNRITNDGDLIRFYQNDVLEGTISVSGSTVSYNGGHLARWSQTADNTRIDGLVKGTVLTNLDQMAVWGDEEIGMPMPSITPNISLGNLLNILAMIVAVSIAWANISNVAQANSRDVGKNDLRINDVEVRVRTLENNQSRTDERLINIIEMLNRIDGRLEKMEGN